MSQSWSSETMTWSADNSNQIKCLTKKLIYWLSGDGLFSFSVLCVLRFSEEHKIIIFEFISFDPWFKSCHYSGMNRNHSWFLCFGGGFLYCEYSILEIEVPNLDGCYFFHATCSEIHQFGQQSVFDRQIWTEDLDLIFGQAWGLTISVGFAHLSCLRSSWIRSSDTSGQCPCSDIILLDLLLKRPSIKSGYDWFLVPIGFLQGASSVESTSLWTNTTIWFALWTHYLYMSLISRKSHRKALGNDVIDQFDGRWGTVFSDTDVTHSKFILQIHCYNKTFC